MLSSCDGSIISNGIINVDFHFIKDECTCAFESNVSLLYYLSNYPKYDCVTGIEITQIDNTIQILRCSSDSNKIGSITASLATQVQLTGVIRSQYRNEDYCLSVFSNGKTYCLSVFSNIKTYCVSVLSNCLSVLVKTYCLSVSSIVERRIA